MNARIHLLSLILLCAGVATANEDLRFADSCYAARAERSVEDRADAENAKKMIAAYKRAQADPAVAEAATAGVVRSIYYAFRFVPFEKVGKEINIKYFDPSYTVRSIPAKGTDAIFCYQLAENAVHAAMAGKTDMVVGSMNGTAANNYQILGRAHQLLPYIPIILSWPDKALAEKYLVMALEQDPKDLYNYFFLAELRFDQKRYADALNIINRGLARGIRTSDFLEDKRGRWKLKELQKKINAKLDKKQAKN